ncbi:hypothetical protein WA026_002946 [Henosepilachna vigintioctopunctata]|uniref:Uncharacterized protein n=1 Tax=Henosepilachna vigintioctopunctata TaxID=420089 RepID=A0AAW1TIQ8_9CUCU
MKKHETSNSKTYWIIRRNESVRGYWPIGLRFSQILLKSNYQVCVSELALQIFILQFMQYVLYILYLDMMGSPLRII